MTSQMKTEVPDAEEDGPILSEIAAMSDFLAANKSLLEEAANGPDRSMVLIQGHRFEIYVSCNQRRPTTNGKPGKRKVSTRFFDQVICKECEGLSSKGFKQRLLAYAEKQAVKLDPFPGEEYDLDSHSLLISYGKVDAQIPHADCDAPNCQFAMMVSDNTPGTTEYTGSHDITTIDDLVKYVPEWKDLPVALREAMRNDKFIVDRIAKYGNTLHTNIKAVNEPDKLHPRGTTFSLTGSTLHAGPAFHMFRAVFFYAGQPKRKNVQPYDPEVQLFGANLMSDIVHRMWGMFDSSEDQDVRDFLTNLQTMYSEMALEMVDTVSAFMAPGEGKRITQRLEQAKESQSLPEPKAKRRKTKKVRRTVAKRTALAFGQDEEVEATSLPVAPSNEPPLKALDQAASDTLGAAAESTTDVAEASYQVQPSSLIGCAATHAFYLQLAMQFQSGHALDIKAALHSQNWEAAIEFVKKHPQGARSLQLANGRESSVLLQVIEARQNKDIDGRVRLMTAIIEGDPKAAEYTNSEGIYPMHRIAQRDTGFPKLARETIMVALLKACPQTLNKNNDRTGNTPLHILASSGCSVSLLKECLNTGWGRLACLNPNKKGELPAHMMVRRNTKACAELLPLLIGANPAALLARSSDGKTPLEQALSDPRNCLVGTIKELMAQHYPQAAHR